MPIKSSLNLGAKVTGIGTYRPKLIVKNNDIAAKINSSDEWIRERSGILERRYANANETVVSMAVQACNEAIKNSGITPSEIDLVILATATNPAQLPNLSMEIAHEIKAFNAGAFDIGAACSGFTYAISMANSSVVSGDSKNVIVVGSERMTDFVSEFDRGTAFLFADGAGAFVISQSKEFQISNSVWGADGSLKDWICMTKNWPEFYDNPNDGFPAVKMEGQKVFRWAITEMVGIAQKILDEAGVAV
ncbi:MAG: beta-ketoacyl-ACP synthase 3, partial [Actinomycetes bacterium]